MKRLMPFLCAVVVAGCDPAHIVKFDATPRSEAARPVADVLAPIEQRFQLTKHGSDANFTIGREWHSVEHGHPSTIWITCRRTDDRWEFTLVEWLVFRESPFGAQLRSAAWDELRDSGYEVVLRK